MPSKQDDSDLVLFEREDSTAILTMNRPEYRNAQNLALLYALDAQMPRFGLTLAKKAVNQAEDLMGLRAGMDASFALHQLGHSHNAETIGHSNGGQSVESIRSTVNNANRSER